MAGNLHSETREGLDMPENLPYKSCKDLLRRELHSLVTRIEMALPYPTHPDLTRRYGIFAR